MRARDVAGDGEAEPGAARILVARLVNVWLDDDDSGMAATMAELDRTLRRGDMLVARAQDVERLTSPLRSLARGVVSAGIRFVSNRRSKANEEETSAT